MKLWNWKTRGNLIREYTIPVAPDKTEKEFNNLIKLDSIGYKIKFKDAWGKPFEYSGNLKLGEILQSWKEADMLYKGESLKEIANQLKEINNKIMSAKKKL